MIRVGPVARLTSQLIPGLSRLRSADSAQSLEFEMDGDPGHTSYITHWHSVSLSTGTVTGMTRTVAGQRPGRDETVQLELDNTT